MLNTQYSTIIFILLVAVLNFSTVPCVASDDIGLLPFSRLASEPVKKQVGQYYQPPALEKALIAALQKEGISAKLANYPADQQPFTYDEIDAPQFDIDADDFATPEQILSDIASNQGFKQIIFGHIEEVSDDLYLAARVYSTSGGIRSAEEQKINLKSLTPKEVEKALHQLAVKIKTLLQKPQSQLSFSRNPLDEPDTNDVGLLGLDDSSKVGYSVEDIYRRILEYEFYVHPAKKHQKTIDNLARKFSTTAAKLKKELKTHYRSAQLRYQGKEFGPLLYMVTSNPTQKRKKYFFIAPSSEVFDLCIFEPGNPHFGSKWLTHDEAKSILEKIRKVQIKTDEGRMPLKWRIPTIQELFAITQYLPWTKRAEGYSFWSDTLTATGDIWTIRKFPKRNNKYGIDFDSASTSSKDKALLIAVLTCPPP